MTFQAYLARECISIPSIPSKFQHSIMFAHGPECSHSYHQVETEGDVATANTLARILSNIPPSRGGPTSVVIFDIHALQVSCLDWS